MSSEREALADAVVDALVDRRGRWLSLAFALGVGSALLAVIVAASHPGSPASTIARGAFAPFCHQDPARSFAWGGEALCICHRCFGIYAGLFVGALGAAAAPRLPLDPGSRRIWLVALVPMGLHVAVLNLWSPADLVALRVGTGALFGLWGGYAATRALASMLATPAPRGAADDSFAEPFEAGRSEA